MATRCAGTFKRIQTAWKQLKTAAQNPPTQARYPALAHFFPCNEVTGSTYIECSITGVRINKTVTNNGNGSLTLGGTASVTGAFTPPVAKKVVAVICAKLTSATIAFIQIGDVGAATGTRGFKFNLGSTAASNNVKIDAGTAVISGTAVSAGLNSTACVAFTVDIASATGLSGAKKYITSIPVDTAVASITAAGNLVAVTADLTYLGTNSTTPQAAITGLDVYSIALFYLDSLPSADELKSMTVWTYENTVTDTNHNKTVWPGFLGRT